MASICDGVVSVFLALLRRQSVLKLLTGHVYLCALEPVTTLDSVFRTEFPALPTHEGDGRRSSRASAPQPRQPLLCFHFASASFRSWMPGYRASSRLPRHFNPGRASHGGGAPLSTKSRYLSCLSELTLEARPPASMCSRLRRLTSCGRRTRESAPQCRAFCTSRPVNIASARLPATILVAQTAVLVAHGSRNRLSCRPFVLGGM